MGAKFQPPSEGSSKMKLQGQEGGGAVSAHRAVAGDWINVYVIAPQHLHTFPGVPHRFS